MECPYLGAGHTHKQSAATIAAATKDCPYLQQHATAEINSGGNGKVFSTCPCTSQFKSHMKDCPYLAHATEAVAASSDAAVDASL
jgi:hypothetical protein